MRNKDICKNCKQAILYHVNYELKATCKLNNSKVDISYTCKEFSPKLEIITK